MKAPFSQPSQGPIRILGGSYKGRPPLLTRRENFETLLLKVILWVLWVLFGTENEVQNVFKNRSGPFWDIRALNNGIMVGQPLTNQKRRVLTRHNLKGNTFNNKKMQQTFKS